MGGAHPYLPAPYGIYTTADGFLALALSPVPRLGELLELPELLVYRDPDSWFEHRDEIKAALAVCLRRQSTAHWLAILEAADIWCADVLTWARLLEHDGFRALGMVQRVRRGDAGFLTTRCPVRLDGQIITAEAAAPRLGEHGPLVGDTE